MKRVMSIFDFLKFKKIQSSSRISLDWQDKQMTQQRWDKILQMLDDGRPSNFRQAILEADKLMGYVLKKMQLHGETMGERLKAARSRFSPKIYQGLWDAHKIRNRLVHEFSSEVLNYEAKEAIEKYKKALEDLGVL